MIHRTQAIAEQSLLTPKDASGKLWDVLVIGGGATGLTTALELSRVSTKSVAIVSLGDPANTIHLSYRADRQGDQRARKFWKSRNKNYTPVPGLNGHIGGRSICWHGVVLRLDEKTLKKWPNEMQSRLNGTNGLYSHYENQLTAWKGSPLSEPTCDYENSMLALMSTSDGWTLVPQASKSAFINGERRWSVYTPLSAWQYSPSDQVRTDSLPKILCGMLTENIRQCKNNSIFEIDCSHIEMGLVKLKAKEVVLAAGTLESTRLYSTLSSNASFQVYPNLNDHFVHGAVVRLPKTIEENYDVGNRAFLMRTFDNLRANLFLDIHADCHGIPTLDLWWKGEQSRNLNSRIAVRQIAGKWLAVCESNLSSEDLDRIEEQRHIIREELAKFGVKPPPARKFDFVTAMKSISIGSQGEFYLNKLGTADHEAGTLPYGEIFSEVGRSKVFPNLFLASPAGFPWSGYANPTLTSISVAKMVAEEIAK